MSYDPSGNFKHLILSTSPYADGSRLIHLFHGYGPPVNGVNQFDYFISNNVNTDPPSPQYFPVWNAARPEIAQVDKWICFEMHADLRTNVHELYVTTRDGAWRGECVRSMPLADTVSLFQGISVLGMESSTGLAVQDPLQHYMDISDVLVSTARRGPPRGFVSYATRSAITVNVPAGGALNRTSPTVALPIGAYFIDIGLTRALLPNTPDIGELRIYLSLDGGTTFLPSYHGFKISGGVLLDGSGQVLTESTCRLYPLPEPRNPNRRIYAQLLRSVGFATTLRADVL